MIKNKILRKLIGYILLILTTSFTVGTVLILADKKFDLENVIVSYIATTIFVTIIFIVVQSFKFSISLIEDKNKDKHEQKI